VTERLKLLVAQACNSLTGQAECSKHRNLLYGFPPRSAKYTSERLLPLARGTKSLYRPSSSWLRKAVQYRG